MIHIELVFADGHNAMVIARDDETGAVAVGFDPAWPGDTNDES